MFLTCAKLSASIFFSKYFRTHFVAIFSGRRSDLSTIPPARSTARMPGAGSPRRSREAGRKMGIVGKSLIEAGPRYGLSLCFPPTCINAPGQTKSFPL